MTAIEAGTFKFYEPNSFVDLSGNAISRLAPGAIAGNSSVEVRVGYNQLTRLEAGSVTVGAGSSVWVNNNAIQIVEPGAISG